MGRQIAAVLEESRHVVLCLERDELRGRTAGVHRAWCNLRSAPDRVMLPEIGAIRRPPVPRTLLSVPESGLGGCVCRRIARVLGPLTRRSFHSQKMAPALL